MLLKNCCDAKSVFGKCRKPRDEDAKITFTSPFHSHLQFPQLVNVQWRATAENVRQCNDPLMTKKQFAPTHVPPEINLSSYTACNRLSRKPFSKGCRVIQLSRTGQCWQLTDWSLQSLLTLPPDTRSNNEDH